MFEHGFMLRPGDALCIHPALRGFGPRFLNIDPLDTSSLR
jgi:hypothetical protein